MLQGTSEPFETPIQIDTTEFPIVLITLPSEMTVEDISAHYANMELLFHRRGPCVAIVDINGVDATQNTARQRERFASGSDHLAHLQALRGEVVVAKSPLLRGLVTAYSWLRRNKNHPFACVATRAEAATWAANVLEGRSNSTPAPDSRKSGRPEPVHSPLDMRTPKPLRRYD